MKIKIVEKYSSALTLFFTLIILTNSASAALIPPPPCDFVGNEIIKGTLQVGDTVSAKDPDGVLCNPVPCKVETAGQYGVLRAYPDDPNTPAIDEGAEELDRMTFYLKSLLATTDIAIWRAGQTVRADIASSEKVTMIDPDQIGPGGLQEAIDAVKTGVAYLSKGEYAGDITLRNGKSLIGQRPYSTIPYPVILQGNIICMESDSLLKYIEILYQKGSYRNFTNTNYNNFSLLTDAGITAIDSDISVKNCIIMPDLDEINLCEDYDPPLEHYGKGIQIWNMYGSTEKSPTIENNLIRKAETGIYLFSQASGGAIKGEIANNTLGGNRYGIVLRMHRENPLIRYNILANSSASAIMYTYADELDSRISHTTDNVFLENPFNIWCDALQRDVSVKEVCRALYRGGPVVCENPYRNIYEGYTDSPYEDLGLEYEGKGFTLE